MTVTIEETTIEDDGPDGRVQMYTLKNSNNMTVKVMSYGATIVSIEVPDKNGVVKDVVLGFDTSRNLSGFRDSKVNPYFGATVGRVANRIKNAKYVEPFGSNQVHRLTPNIDPHHLHGGEKGFSFVNWKLHLKCKDAVIFSHRSEDGDEGYPGTVVATVQYKLGNENILYVHMEARTDKNTIINMTNHAYFNLAGHNAGKEKLYEHFVAINADNYISVDEMLLPNKIEPVANTPFDFRQSANIADRIAHLLPEHEGFDHNFCIQNVNNKPDEIAAVYHPESGRVMKIISDQVGVQFYTANSMPDMTQQEKYPTKDGCVYDKKHAAFCLESQKWPDAPNKIYFTKIKLSPDKLYKNNIVYTFGCVNFKENLSKAISYYNKEAQLVGRISKRYRKSKAKRDGRPIHLESGAPLYFGVPRLDDSIYSTIYSLYNYTGSVRPSSSSLDPSSYPSSSSRSSKSGYPSQTSGSASSFSKTLSSHNSSRKSSTSASVSSSSSLKSAVLSDNSALLSDTQPSPRIIPTFANDRPSAFSDYGTSPTKSNNSNVVPKSWWRKFFGCLCQSTYSLRTVYRRCQRQFLTFWAIIKARLFCEQSESRRDTQLTEQQIVLSNNVRLNEFDVITRRLRFLWEYLIYCRDEEKKDIEMQEVSCKDSEESTNEERSVNLSPTISYPSDYQNKASKLAFNVTADKLHTSIQTKVQVHSTPREANESPQRLPSYKNQSLPRLAMDTDEIIVIETNIEIVTESGATFTKKAKTKKFRPTAERLDSIDEIDDDDITIVSTNTNDNAAEYFDAIYELYDDTTIDGISEIDSQEIDDPTRQSTTESDAGLIISTNVSKSRPSIEQSDTMSDIAEDMLGLERQLDERSDARLDRSTEVGEYEATIAESTTTQVTTTDTYSSGDIQTDTEGGRPKAAVAKNTGAIPKQRRKDKFY